MHCCIGLSVRAGYEKLVAFLEMEDVYVQAYEVEYRSTTEEKMMIGAAYYTSFFVIVLSLVIRVILSRLITINSKFVYWCASDCTRASILNSFDDTLISLSKSSYLFSCIMQLLTTTTTNNN